MDAKTLKFLEKKDKVMARLIREVGPIDLKPDALQSPYRALVRSVVFQQLHGKAAATILGRVVDLYPGKVFPDPEDLLKTQDKKLRAAGLSYSKILAVKDIATKTIEGVVPSTRKIARMENEDIIERLTSIRGVGLWTVEMMLIFKLGRPDVLPSTDFGVRKGFSITYGHKEMPTPKALLAYGEIWRPYRTTAAWYLWRAADRAKLVGAKKKVTKRANKERS
jgi:DNA-3-methyladenine glycosylase II